MSIPPEAEGITNWGSFTDHIRVLGDSDASISRIVTAEREAKAPRNLTFLDVGGRQGERRGFAKGMRYSSIDIAPRSPDVIQGDICHCPEIPDGSYDVVASFEVLEHVAEPWRAAEECVRIVRPGGLLIHRAPFAYRYHPCPQDYWRFSAQGLTALFERTGQISEVLLCGYDLRRRRWDSTQHGTGGWPTRRDVPPVDALGGFVENWLAVVVLRTRGSTREGLRDRIARRAEGALGRKGRKLVLDPAAFVRDAIKNRRSR